MRHSLGFVLAIGAAACAIEGDRSEPAPKFGYLTAVVDGTPLVGRFGPDSVVAVYSAGPGQLQIEGASNPGRRGSVVRLILRCSERPGSGVYKVSGFTSPVHAEAYVPAPRVGGWFKRREDELHAFVNDSTSPGRLELEELNWITGVTRSRFAVTLRSINRASETVTVRGTFAGRLFISPRESLIPGGDWSPDFDRNCAAALTTGTSNQSGAAV